MPTTSFTEHAFDSVYTRLRLSPSEVATILDQDKCVLLGRDGSSNRLHRLFFSNPDAYWFVAVQDEKTGEVVTVLPIDYHNRWKISGDALSLARSQIRNEKLSIVLTHEPYLPIEGVVLRFQALVRNKRNKMRIVGLGNLEYGSSDLLRAIHDPALRPILQDRLLPELLEGESLASLVLRIGKRKQRKQMTVHLTALL